MKRTKLKDRELPTYSRGEEIFNMVSHIIGGIMGIVAITLSAIIAGKKHNVYGVVSGVIYGTSLLILYTMSSLYHGLSPKVKAKKVFQIIDHCTIFVLIAGTYTPFALCTLRQYNVALGWSIFGIIWGIAILGIVLNSIDLKMFKIFSMISYLVMGWLIIIRIDIIYKAIGLCGFLLLLIGGIIYTIGAIFYIIGKKKKWMHSVFHIACIIGSLLHLLCILIYVI